MRAYCCLIFALSFALTNAFARGNDTTILCQDVTKLDFKNLTISRANRIFAFNDGIALNYDTPETDRSAPPDWEAEVKWESVVHPTSGIKIRFLLIHDSHLTGSGWNYWLVGYKCSDGSLEQVFSLDGLSLEVDGLDDSGVVVSKMLTSGSSVRTYWSYFWDKNLSTYTLGASWSATGPQEKD